MSSSVTVTQAAVSLAMKSLSLRIGIQTLQQRHFVLNTGKLRPREARCLSQNHMACYQQSWSQNSGGSGFSVPRVSSHLLIPRRFVTIRGIPAVPVLLLVLCTHREAASADDLFLTCCCLPGRGCLSSLTACLPNVLCLSFSPDPGRSASLERLDNPPSTTRQGKVSQLVTKQSLGPVCPGVVTRAMSTTCAPYAPFTITLESLVPMCRFPSLQLLYTEPPWK